MLEHLQETVLAGEFIQFRRRFVPRPVVHIDHFKRPFCLKSSRYLIDQRANIAAFIF